MGRHIGARGVAAIMAAILLVMDAGVSGMSLSAYAASRTSSETIRGNSENEEPTKEAVLVDPIVVDSDQQDTLNEQNAKMTESADPGATDQMASGTDAVITDGAPAAGFDFGEKIEVEEVATDQTEPEAPMMAQADATSGTCGENATWSYNSEDRTLTISGSGKMEDYDSGTEKPWDSFSIRRVIVEEGITYIGNMSFAYEHNINEIRLPASLIEIGVGAFYENTRLGSITFPVNLSKIGEGAFAFCANLKSLDIPESVTELSRGVFSECISVTKISMPEVVTIREYALQGIPIEKLSIPGSVKTIEPYAFFDSPIKEYDVEDTNTAFAAVDGILYNKAITKLISYPCGKEGERYEMPASVTSAEKGAFLGNANLKYVTLSNALTEMSESMFQNCAGLEEFSVPDTVTSFGYYVFNGCENLRTISFGSGVSVITYRMFEGCTALQNIDFGSIEKIENLAFYKCSALASLKIPSTVREIGVSSFRECTELTSLEMEEGISIISAYSFAYCPNLRNVVVPESATLVGAKAFDETVAVEVLNKKLMLLENGAYIRGETILINRTARNDYAFEVLSLVNKERKKLGLNELKMDETQMDAAMQRAVEVSIYMDASHDRTNGLSCFSLNDNAFGENCAAYSDSPEGVLEQWMNSPGHKANILDNSWTSIGIGCVQVDERYFWVQRFGTTDLESDCVQKPNSNENVEVVLSFNDDESSESNLHFEFTTYVNDEIPCGISLPCEIYVKETSNSNRTGMGKVVASSLNWATENQNILSVTEDGIITGNDVGTTKITVSTANNLLQLSRDITVYRETGWVLLSGDYYYFDENGIMYTGWKRMMDEGKYYWFYFGADGRSRDGWETIDGKTYFFDGWGRLRLGWNEILRKWYYFGADGAMRTGWAQVGKTWYYLGTDGVMQTGWVKTGGMWYFFDSNGAMKTGWMQEGKNWYYLRSNGSMCTGWAQVGGIWYYMNSSGVMQKGWVKTGNSWYYFKASGAMATGWIKLSGNWYYLGTSGAMVTGTKEIGGKVYKFNASGVCLNP